MPSKSASKSSSSSTSAATSRGARAGIHIPIARVARALQGGRKRTRVSASASVLATAALQTLIERVVKALPAGQEGKPSQAAPEEFFQALRNDKEFAPLVARLTLCNAVA